MVTTNASGQATASAFSANTKSGGAYSVTTAVSGVTSPPTFSETNTAGAPNQVNITPTPTSTAASTTTSIALGFQLVDQYGNNTTAGTGGISLSVSSTSTKDFFSSANGGTGAIEHPGQRDLRQRRGHGDRVLRRRGGGHLDGQRAQRPVQQLGLDRGHDHGQDDE